MTYGPVSLTRLRDFRYLHSLNVALSRAMTTSNCIGRHSQAAWRSRTLQEATQIDQKRRTWRCLSASSSTCDPANMRGSSPWTLGATPIYQGDCLPDRMCGRVVGMENIHTYTPALTPYKSHLPLDLLRDTEQNSTRGPQCHRIA